MDSFERTYLCLATFVLTVACCGLLLAEFGIFGARFAGVGGLLAAGSFLYATGKLPRVAVHPGWTSLLFISALLGYWLLVALPPFDMVLGGVDPGCYVNTAAQIRASGAILIHDPIASAADKIPILNQVFLPWDNQYLPGFYVFGDVIVPQFYHTYPVLLAFVGSFLGSPAALYVTPILALLNAMGLFLVVRRWWHGTATAVLAVALLASNVSFVWFARCANSEVLALQFFLAGLLALHFAEECAAARAAQGWGVLSAAFLGAAFLTRIDMIYLFPALLVAWAMMLWRGKARLAFTWVFVLGLFLLWTFIHAYFFAFTYFYSTFDQIGVLPFLRKHSVFFLAAGLVLFGLLLALAWILQPANAVRRVIQPWVQRGLTMLFPAVALLLLGVAACYYLFHLEVLKWLEWYCGIPVLGLFVVGVLSWSKEAGKSSPIPVSLMLLFVAGLTTLIVLGPSPMVHVRHFWASRRLLVFVFPFVSLLAAHGLSKGIRWIGKWGGIALVLVAFIPGIHNIRPLVHFQMYDNAPEDLQRLAEHIPPNSIVLCGPSGEWKIPTPLRFMYGLHAFGFNQDVLTVEALDALSKAYPGRELVLVTIAPVYPKVELPYKLEGDPLVSVPMKWEEFDEPESHLPRSFDYLQGTLEAWRISKLGLNELFDSTAATLEIAGVKTSGLYDPDPATSFRWTNGQAELLIPRELVKGSRMVYVVLADNRPQPTETEIVLNSQRLGAVRAEPGQIMTLPYRLQGDWLGESANVRLELRTPTWVPAEVIGGKDTRKLGVMLFEVRFQK